MSLEYPQIQTDHRTLYLTSDMMIPYSCQRCTKRKMLKVFTWVLLQGCILTRYVKVLILLLNSSHKEICSVPEKVIKVVMNVFSMKWRGTWGKKTNLKKLMSLIFESSSMAEVLSNACPIWCNHLFAASCVRGNGRCLAISAGCPDMHNPYRIKGLNCD